MEFNILEAYQSLSDYQKNVVSRSIVDFFNLNQEISDTRPSVCPLALKHSIHLSIPSCCFFEHNSISFSPIILILP
jgi:hypothetical protein